MASGGVLAYVRLSAPQAKLLEFIAERAGEIAWDWSRCRPDVTQMVRQMVDDQRVLVDLPAQRCLRLTDAGREAVAQIQAAVARGRGVVRG